MNNSKSTIAVIVGIIVLVCCICLLVLGVGGVIVYETGKSVSNIGLPMPNSDFGTPTPVPELKTTPAAQVSTDTLSTLQTTIVPENDLYDLACRLKSVCGVPTTLPAPTAPLTVGTTQQFWILNSDTNKNSQIDATLMFITPHSYFWAEKGTNVNQDDMKALMDTFENKIYPTDREFFGSEWTPGVDSDPHIYVLYAKNIGSNIAGYFSTLDEYNPLVAQYSNAHETYVLSASQDLSAQYTYATLAHEFVHMIQWPSDRNDVSWINEGFAEVGAFLNGYDVGGADWLYAQSPDLQLNTWVGNSDSSFGMHYGQSFLYLTYFLDRFGEKATKALTQNPENDLTSVDDTLKTLNVTDPQTGKLITADDVFMDWAAALYLKDSSVGDGRYTYHNYPGAPQTSATETISSCPQSPLVRSVNQYGIDYIKIDCSGNYTLDFTGSTSTKLLPVDPPSGSYAFWSNRGDESDMTLTREFDLTNVTGPVEMSYKTWYDVEKDYDYVFVEASEDGQTWQILTTPSGTADNPSGNSYGWGYNGTSNGWLNEKVDLSQFAGKKVQVRFEYVTDAAVNGEGFLVDDIKVDAINYSTDFEKDDGGWVGKGFARVENILPQTYRLSLIIQGTTTTVQTIPLDPDQKASIPLTLKNGETATLIVTGTARFTRAPASYQIEIK